MIAFSFFTLNVTAGNSKDEQQQIEKRIEKLIKKMTLEEKVSLLHGNSKFHVAAIPRLGIPEWSLSDGPHGVRAEIKRDSWSYAGWTTDSSTYFPTGTAMAAAWNPALAHHRGEVLGEEARWRKKDVLLGPGVNIIRDPLCGRNFEYLSEDPYLNGVLASQYVKGLQSRDVAASVKHFALNNQETNRMDYEAICSERALREIYLPAFKAVVQDGGALTVMAAYDKYLGHFCAENEYLANTILRKEWGFDGCYVSDWGAVHSTVPSTHARLDLEMGTNIKDYKNWYYANPLLEAVRKGEVKESTIDQLVADNLRVMIKTKVLDPKKRFNGGCINTPEHQQSAYKAATEAVVLLKNEGKLLPLDASKLKSIAVIGDNATRKHSFGGQSSEIKALYEVTPLEALQKKYGNSLQINFAQGYEKLTQYKDMGDNGLTAGQLTTARQQSRKLLDEAVEAARKSDVAIVFAGLNHDYDTESADRKDMELPYGQNQLIQEVVRANPRTIVVVVAGSPLNLCSVNLCVPSIVWGWYDGMEAGNAFADVLFGNVNPSGKMPFSVPYNLMQAPAHAFGNFPGLDKKVHYDEGILVGYRWYDTKQLPVLYPFGYGLSYTTFDYNRLATDKQTYSANDTINVTFQLKNSGERDGAEVAELYVSDPECSVLRPVKELKGFSKEYLRAGESRDVTIRVPVAQLAFYSEAAKKFVVEPGKFIIHIAASAADVRQSVEINVN